MGRRLPKEYPFVLYATKSELDPENNRFKQIAKKRAADCSRL